MFWTVAEIVCKCNNNPDQSSTQTVWVTVATRAIIFCAATDLIRVGDVWAAVAGVSHTVPVPVQLVSVLNTLAVVQNVLQACWRKDNLVVSYHQQFQPSALIQNCRASLSLSLLS